MEAWVAPTEAESPAEDEPVEDIVSSEPAPAREYPDSAAAQPAAERERMTVHNRIRFFILFIRCSSAISFR